MALDPTGTPAETGTSFCWDTRFTTDDRHLVSYRGNGVYTLQISLFRDRDCKTPNSTINLQWTVGASVALGAPAGPLPTRQAGSFNTIMQQLDFAPNPGAVTYEIKFAKGGVVQPDGSLSSPALKDGFFNRATGKVEIIGATEPGEYVVVARGRSGDYYTAWSPPITMKLMAPFDFSTRTFPDQRGPRYSVRATLREASAAGSRVTVAVAKGKNGKRFQHARQGEGLQQGRLQAQLHDPPARQVPAPLLVPGQRDGRPRHDLRGHHDPPRARLRAMRV